MGKKYEILIDEKLPEQSLYIGHTTFQSPEIDGSVFIWAENLKIGEIYKVVITESSDYDLYGKILDPVSQITINNNENVSSFHY